MAHTAHSTAGTPVPKWVSVGHHIMPQPRLAPPAEPRAQPQPHSKSGCTGPPAAPDGQGRGSCEAPAPAPALWAALQAGLGLSWAQAALAVCRGH